MPASKKKSYKAKMKSRVVPCTDANQRVKERAAEKKRQTDALIKKIATMRAKQELERRQHAAMGVDTSTQNIGVIDGLASATE